MSDATLFIRCDCHSPEHMMLFDVWHWDAEVPQNSELIFSYNLDCHLPMWKRLLLGLRYGFTGNTSRNWWHDTVINDTDAAMLRDFLADYLNKNLNARRSA